MPDIKLSPGETLSVAVRAAPTAGARTAGSRLDPSQNLRCMLAAAQLQSGRRCGAEHLRGHRSRHHGVVVEAEPHWPQMRDRVTASR